ncbi:MAG: hypothetical protein ACK4NX_00570, partial [Candidatus Paceibacteria bacterium]
MVYYKEGDSQKMTSVAIKKTTSLLSSILLVIIIFEGILIVYAYRIIRRGAVGDTSENLVVIVRDNYFEPKEVRATFGDTIIWENKGLRIHSVTFDKFSKTIFPGEKWELKVTPEMFHEGINTYFDDAFYDQGMQASLIIA